MPADLTVTIDRIEKEAALWEGQQAPMNRCASTIAASSLTDQNLAIPGTASFWTEYKKIQDFLQDLTSSASKEFQEIASALHTNARAYKANEAASTEHIQGGY